MTTLPGNQTTETIPTYQRRIVGINRPTINGRKCVVYVEGLFDEEGRQLTHTDEATGKECAVVFLSYPIPIGLEKCKFDD